MAEFAIRERQFNQGLPAIMESFALGMVVADNAAKDAYVHRQIMLMNQEEPNVQFMARTTLIGLDEALVTKVSVPKIILAPNRPMQIERAYMSMDMSVSAHAEDNLAIQSNTEVEGSASIGLGLFKASMRIKASLSVASEKKRSSDYTSTTHADLTMSQGEAPEGLMKIIDSLNLTTTRALELNADIIEQQYPALAAAAAAAEAEEEAA